MNKGDYLSKINDLLKDGSKFRKITKNPCDDIKAKVNKLIDRATEETGKTIPIKKIVGDYSPGYVYGNVKTTSQERSFVQSSPKLQHQRTVQPKKSTRSSNVTCLKVEC